MNPRSLGCTALNGSTAVVCPKLDAELARARQRAKLQVNIDTARADLARMQAPKVANSDAVALATYATALGWNVDADFLNKLLVLLAVLLVECGGGLSLAVGVALSGAPTAPAADNDTKQEASAEAAGPAERPLPAPLAPRPPAVGPTRSPGHRPLAGLPEAVAGWLAANGGRADSVRCIATAVGRAPSSVGDAVRRLANDRRVVLARGAGGRTVIQLAPIGALN